MLRCVSIEAGEAVPPAWYERHAFGLVRRGVLIRQRIDAQGERAAVDAATPGCLVPLRMARGASVSTGYAATRVVLCVYPRPELAPEDTVRAGHDLLRLMEESVDRLERIAAARGQPSAHERIRALIDALAEPATDARGPRPLRLRQKDMALLLHLRPETVCRALRRLTSEGAIRPVEDGVEALIEVAGERR